MPVAFHAQVLADAIEEFGWRGTGRGRRIFRDAKATIGFGNDGKGSRGRLPPVVSSLFSIKSAHRRHATEFEIDGEGERQRNAPRYGKARGARD